MERDVFGRVAGYVPLLLLVALAIYLFPWQWYQSQRVVAVHLSNVQSDGDRILQLSTGTCNADFESATASVSSEMVRLTIKMSGNEPQHDCADGVTVRLPQPLGGRVLVDGSTGETLPVTTATFLVDEQWVRPVELIR